MIHRWRCNARTFEHTFFVQNWAVRIQLRRQGGGYGIVNAGGYGVVNAGGYGVVKAGGYGVGGSAQVHPKSFLVYCIGYPNECMFENKLKMPN